MASSYWVNARPYAPLDRISSPASTYAPTSARLVPRPVTGDPAAPPARGTTAPCALAPLLAPVLAAQRSSRPDNPVVQRVITVGGFYAVLRTDTANEDFKKLPDSARTLIEQQHKDRTSTY